MSGVSVSRSDRRRAQALLRSVMAEAEAMAETMQTGFTLQAQSPIGQATFAQISRANLYGLHIYRRVPWGWYADLLLKDMPPGVPDVMGTPTSTPLASEEEARRAGILIVASILAHAPTEQPKEPLPDYRHFDFYGVYLRLPLEAVEMCVVAAEAFQERRSDAECFNNLEQLKKQFFGDGEVTFEAFDALSQEGRAQIMTGCLIAFALNNIFRAPSSVPDVEDWQG